jgi:transposase
MATLDKAACTPGGKPGPSGREEQLQAQIDELTTALGQAHVELRVWKRSAERLAPSRTSR